jgi:hypothetical protein
VRRVLAVCLMLALAAPAGAQAPTVSDPDVLLGIRQAEDGEYDAAILTLDNAARRLSAEPARARELSQAYLYLGVAYVGKGYEAAAKARFRDAVTQLRDMTLSPDKFPPRVIDLFEAAREEVAKAPAPQPSAAPEAAAGGGGGHGKKWLVFGGLGAAAATGAILALGGGASCGQVEAFRSGPLSRPGDASVDLTGGPAVEAGIWTAELSWTGGPPAETDLLLRIFDSAGTAIVEGIPHGGPNQKLAEWNGQPGVVYTARVMLVGGGPVNFELFMDGPCLN